MKPISCFFIAFNSLYSVDGKRKQFHFFVTRRAMNSLTAILEIISLGLTHFGCENGLLFHTLYEFDIQ